MTTKFDTGKPRYDLVPALALHALVRVLTFGAKKYAPDNWRTVPNARARYFSAAQRHLWLWWRGERVDPETGESHLAHALCCVAFLLDAEEAGGPDIERLEGGHRADCNVFALNGTCDCQPAVGGA